MKVVPRTAGPASANLQGRKPRDRRHHLQLLKAHMAGVGSAPCRAMVAEDTRNLQSRARHARRVSRGASSMGGGLNKLGSSTLRNRESPLHQPKKRRGRSNEGTAA